MAQELERLREISDAARSELFDGLYGAGEDRDVASERVGDGGEEGQARSLRRRQGEGDERVAAEELAVEDADAVESGRLDIPDQIDELGQRVGTGDAEGDADGHWQGILPVGTGG